VKNVGTGAVTVARSGTALIEGATTAVLSPNQAATLIADGTNWRQVATAPGVPVAPTIGTATAGVSAADVAFTPPTVTGGSPISSYTATATPGGATATGTASPITVTGLNAGTAYTFTVRATSAGGTSPESAASNSVTPTASPTAPPAPTIGTATSAGATSVTVTHATNGTGGSAITGCTITPYIAGVAQTAQTFNDALLTHTLTGLTTGTAYTFKVALTNSIGTGAQSAASNSATPSAPGASDTFTRADAASLGTSSGGQPWTTHLGGFSISTNAAKVSSGSPAVASVEATLADATVKADMTFNPSGSGEVGVVARLSDGTHYIHATLYSGTVYLLKQNAGVVNLGSLAGQPTTGTHELKLVCSGTSLSVYVDGVLQLGPTTDAFNQTATRVGLTSGNLASDLVSTYDNFSAT